jgi:uncharacterized protein
MEQAISFESGGVTLRGTLHIPDGTSGKRPALVSCHGFGGSSNGAGHPSLARALEKAGYVVLRFDFRGCGDSGGERGRVICMEEVEDVRNAIGVLESHPDVDRERIGLIGASLGGAVVIYTAATDQRVKACVGTGSVANGERLFHIQYPDEAKYRAFLARLEDAKRHRATTGQSVMMNRYDIVLIPEKRRAGMPPGSIMSFPAETAISMLEFSPDEVVAKISPRPLLLIHPRDDDVVPKSESEYLASVAGQPCELKILDTSEHFGSGDPELQRITIDWLGRYL